LQITLFSLAGQDIEARRLVWTALKNKRFDFELLQTGYALGLKLHDQDLAIQSLTLFNQTWPQHAADTFLRMGKVYVELAQPDDAKALEAFKLGLQEVPEGDRTHYLDLIPERLRVLM